jgi:hypothetical protein
MAVSVVTAATAVVEMVAGHQVTAVTVATAAFGFWTALHTLGAIELCHFTRSQPKISSCLDWSSSSSFGNMDTTGEATGGIVSGWIITDQIGRRAKAN